MDTAVIIVAAGRGSRMGGPMPKQWQMLAGRPVLAHTAGAFAGMPLVLVIHPDDRARAEALGIEARLVDGGATRDASVLAGLAALEGTGVSRVLIHDGARPLVSVALIQRLIAALDSHEGAAPALPVTDALWRGAGGLVTGTQGREGLYRAQTPQAFRLAPILAAHRAHPGGAADDVEVARAAGLDVAIVEGEETNLKLTFPGDFARAEAILKGRAMDVRMGNGYDVHAFCEGDHVWLCGVRVPHGKGLLGHSDADVGMHALTDAIYGALAEGDI
ncbi:MAG: 2-C-methyl-D-erythritol 4-phosphate cytidylyltransferase, partial [Rhodobacterales bacterium]